MTLIELKAKAAELGLTPDDVREFGKLSTKEAWEMAIANIETVSTVEDIANKDDICPDCDGTGYASDGGNIFPCWCEIGHEIADEIDLERRATEPTTESTTEPPYYNPAAEPTFAEMYNLCPDPSEYQNFEDFQAHYDAYIKRLWESDDDISQAESGMITAGEIWKQSQHDKPSLDAELKTEIACLIDHPALCEGELLDLVDGSDYLGKDERGLPTHWALINEDAQKVDIYSLAPDAPDNAIASIDIGEKLLTLAEPSATPLRDELTERMRSYVGVTMSDQEFEQLQHEPLDEDTASAFLGWLDFGQEFLAGSGMKQPPGIVDYLIPYLAPYLLPHLGRFIAGFCLTTYAHAILSLIQKR